ncbi:hypothetical protein BC828DRAFT_440034 [Blastocladiella britannica]|nr:hypothetical protein BC828DRAFT_440034 [Blastocladiella britannica]
MSDPSLLSSVFAHQTLPGDPVDTKVIQTQETTPKPDPEFGPGFHFRRLSNTAMSLLDRSGPRRPPPGSSFGTHDTSATVPTSATMALLQHQHHNHQHHSHDDDTGASDDAEMLIYDDHELVDEYGNPYPGGIGGNGGPAMRTDDDGPFAYFLDGGELGDDGHPGGGATGVGNGGGGGGGGPEYGDGADADEDGGFFSMFTSTQFAAPPVAPGTSATPPPPGIPGRETTPIAVTEGSNTHLTVAVSATGDATFAQGLISLLVALILRVRGLIALLPRPTNIGHINENNINWLSPMTYLGLLTFPTAAAVNAGAVREGGPAASPNKTTMLVLRETHLVRNRRRLLVMLTIYTIIMRYTSFDAFAVLLLLSHCLILYYLKNARKFNVQMAKRNIKNRVGWAKQWAGGLFRRGGGAGPDGGPGGPGEQDYMGSVEGAVGFGHDGAVGPGGPSAVPPAEKKKRRPVLPFRKSQPNGTDSTATPPLGHGSSAATVSAAPGATGGGGGRRINNLFRRAASVEDKGNDKGNPFQAGAGATDVAYPEDPSGLGSASNLRSSGASAAPGLAGTSAAVGASASTLAVLGSANGLNDGSAAVEPGNGGGTSSSGPSGKFAKIFSRRTRGQSTSQAGYAASATAIIAAVSAGGGGALPPGIAGPPGAASPGDGHAGATPPALRSGTTTPIHLGTSAEMLVDPNPTSLAPTPVTAPSFASVPLSRSHDSLSTMASVAPPGTDPAATGAGQLNISTTLERKPSTSSTGRSPGHSRSASDGHADGSSGGRSAGGAAGAGTKASRLTKDVVGKAKDFFQHHVKQRDSATPNGSDAPGSSVSAAGPQSLTRPSLEDLAASAAASSVSTPGSSPLSASASASGAVLSAHHRPLPQVPPSSTSGATLRAISSSSSPSSAAAMAELGAPLLLPNVSSSGGGLGGAGGNGPVPTQILTGSMPGMATVSEVLMPLSPATSIREVGR